MIRLGTFSFNRDSTDEMKKTFENLVIRSMPEELHMRNQESIKKPAIAPVTKSKTDQISTKTKPKCLVNTCYTCGLKHHRSKAL
ncbi:hypothetical protein HZH68_016933 [Vespula germanica]|uniref:Uncharacterized protein n=1 Tax=Vespula germanica TaxID=30212 RepID=A0A834MPC4_VESGE|nr:hypothetical protein HZH68_016933 [Vespula germanica]